MASGYENEQDTHSILHIITSAYHCFFIKDFRGLQDFGSLSVTARQAPGGKIRADACQSSEKVNKRDQLAASNPIPISE
jgi:hypothetical protein